MDKLKKRIINLTVQELYEELRNYNILSNLKSDYEIHEARELLFLLEQRRINEKKM